MENSRHKYGNLATKYPWIYGHFSQCIESTCIRQAGGRRRRCEHGADGACGRRQAGRVERWRTETSRRQTATRAAPACTRYASSPSTHHTRPQSTGRTAARLALSFNRIGQVMPICTCLIDLVRNVRLCWFMALALSLSLMALLTSLPTRQHDRFSSVFCAVQRSMRITHRLRTSTHA